jgi:hypothetical protein
MKVLALLHVDEVSLLELVYEALEEKRIQLQTLIFSAPFEGRCAQREEIIGLIAAVDVLVYFASKANGNNTCLDVALREAARLNKKVICIALEGGAIGLGFEQMGDCLISSVQSLPDAVLADALEWQDADGSLREDRPFKRYKCGAKE